jgi:tetratricopeptide (TPR) repeat protein
MPWLVPLALATVVVGPETASAKPKASEAFDEGLALFKQGAYAAAAKKFYAAHRAKPHPFALYNAGLAWELAGEPARAATAYAWALELDLSEKARRDAKKRLERLAPLLGRVEVAVPDGSILRVTPFVVHRTSVVFYLDPGSRRVEVEFPDGSTKTRNVTAAAGETEVVLFEQTHDDSKSEAAPPKRRRRKKERPVASEDRSEERTLGWVALGAAGVAAGTAIVLGLEALKARDEYNASNHRDKKARDRADSYKLWTNVAWGTAAALGVTGGVFLLISHDSDSGANGYYAGARGRF